MPYNTTIAEELRSAVRCSRRVALRATKGQKNRSRDLNRINLATLEANILSIAEKAEMDWDKYCIEKEGEKNNGRNFY